MFPIFRSGQVRRGVPAGVSSAALCGSHRRRMSSATPSARVRTLLLRAHSFVKGYVANRCKASPTQTIIVTLYTRDAASSSQCMQPGRASSFGCRADESQDVLRQGIARVIALAESGSRTFNEPFTGTGDSWTMHGAAGATRVAFTLNRRCARLYDNASGEDHGAGGDRDWYRRRRAQKNDPDDGYLFPSHDRPDRKRY